MSQITEEYVTEQVYQNSLETCIYLSGYTNRFSTLTLKCLIHDLIFETKYENIRHNTRQHHVCPLCKEDDFKKSHPAHLIAKECAYCGKVFYIPKSKERPMMFCCRKHKDLAQRLESGTKFDCIRPDHYNTGKGISSYRQKAFRNYEHKCAICGWNEDIDILEVHHIDSNRENNDLNNLIILCPTCHKKLTSHKYELLDREQIVLIN